MQINHDSNVSLAQNNCISVNSPKYLMHAFRSHCKNLDFLSWTKMMNGVMIVVMHRNDER
jgi:hypothetical protein